jgi:hypothetical protein
MIGIKFTEPELEKAIRQQAKDNGRTIVGQIVWMLTEYLRLMKSTNKKAAAGR